jgi:hypothetical protein
LTTKFNKTLTLTWDYAISGAQIVTSMQKQVEQQFLRTVASKPSYCAWDSQNSLFGNPHSCFSVRLKLCLPFVIASWIGINDINRSTVAERLPLEFILQDELYSVGARNFLFLNVPPFDRSPGGSYSELLKEQIAIWNDLLPTLIQNFTDTHPDSTAFIFNTQDLWTEFYENPAKFNITNVDAKEGGLWYDDWHPETEIQAVIGQRVGQFLDN